MKRFLLATVVTAFVCSFAAAQLVTYDNGVANGVDGVRPTANWDPVGIVDDFTLVSTTGAGTSFDHIRIEVIDGTTPVGVSSLVTSARIEIFALGVGGIAALVHGTDVPVFAQTFSIGGGTMTSTLSGSTFFGRDLEYFDLFAPLTNLGAGHFGIFYTLPGQGAIDHFWATSTAPAPGETPDDTAVFGPGLNTPNGVPSFAFNMTHPIPEPASMIALGLGVAALIARRRRKIA